MRKVHEGSSVLVLDGQTFPKICPKQDPSPIGLSLKTRSFTEGRASTLLGPLHWQIFLPSCSSRLTGETFTSGDPPKTATVATRFPAGLVGVQCIEVLQCILAAFLFQKPGPWWYKYLRYYIHPLWKTMASSDVNPPWSQVPA